MENNPAQTPPPPPIAQPVVAAPPPTPKSSKIKIPLIIAVVIFFLLVIGAAVYAWITMSMTKQLPKIQEKPPANFKSKQVEACPTETKTCPNGITVKRLPPKCDFGPCTGPGAPVATLTPSPIPTTIPIELIP